MIWVVLWAALDVRLLVVVGLSAYIVALDQYIAVILVLLESILLVHVGAIKANYYPGASWNGSKLQLDGYAWQEITVYSASVDPQKYGYSVGLLRRSCFGGMWSDGLHCGSRSLDCLYFSIIASSSLATRGCNQNQYYPGAVIQETGAGSGDNRGLLYESSILEPVYDSNVDSQSYGESYGFLRRNLSGFYWAGSRHAGSRSGYCAFCPSVRYSRGTTRGCKYN